MRGTKVRAMSVVTNSSPSRSLALAVTSPAAFTMMSQPASFSYSSPTLTILALCG